MFRVLAAFLFLLSLAHSAQAHAACKRGEYRFDEAGTVAIIGTFSDDGPMPCGKFKVRTPQGVSGPYRTGGARVSDPVQVDVWTADGKEFYVLNRHGLFGPYDPTTVRSTFGPIGGESLFTGKVHGAYEVVWGNKRWGPYEEVVLLDDMGWDARNEAPFFAYKMGGQWHVFYEDRVYASYDTITRSLTYVAKGKPVITGKRDGKVYVSWGGVEGTFYDEVNLVGMSEDGPRYYGMRDGMLYAVQWPDREEAHPEGFDQMMLNNIEDARRRVEELRKRELEGQELPRPY